jgi:hypothetical protein
VPSHQRGRPGASESSSLFRRSTSVTTTRTSSGSITINENKNTNDNANTSQNANTNTNAQDQDNSQGQDNANDQTNNITSSPEVNIDFGE